MNSAIFRQIHRQIAPIVFIPLFLSAITGIAYSLGKSWFDLPRESTHIFMVIHEAEYFGKYLEPIYVLFLAIGIITMIVTGLTMARSFSKKPKITKWNYRTMHRMVAPIFFLPLLVSATTGVAYRISRSWLGMSRSEADIFLVIHEGKYLGEIFQPIYVLLVGLGLVSIIITGVSMIRWVSLKPKQQMKSEN
ncbi:PepSY domain-containing protein [[Phormidium] sp. ETS-05]|uniref:PepSY domain-containing protein n=1 Tax=[Phormidium] sp. ETS-05 TaxID=222819 RepID=UPI0018EEFD8E|nr:PepSY domain-containing protein [[Phormidium] sp. ETS-05]